LVAQVIHATNDTMIKVSLADIDPTAVCNDGTPAAYYWKKSPTNSNRWLVFLMGGWMCWDKASCENRWKNDPRPNHMAMSSTNFTDTLSMSGIFSPDEKESPMWDANKAFLYYCSSDQHMGELGGPSKATDLWGLKFRG